MTIRKYRSEFALNVYGNFNLLLQQSDFDDLEKANGFHGFEENPCHIYMICRRQRITFDPDAFRVTPGTIAGAIGIHCRDKVERFPFLMDNSKQQPCIKIECPYPHTGARFLNETEGGIQIKAPVLAGMNNILPEHLELEVLYVGQSFGVEGARTAPQRLRSHSTLQGIYAEAIANSPDKDIWLLLWSFESEWITAIDGRKQVMVTTSDAEDMDHIKNVLDHEITEQLEINLAEAGLIRYFRPEYNKIYKDTFPNPAHITYAKCYDLDLNMVNVEINTEGLGSKLKSSARPASWIHYATYPFHSPEERKAMFENLNWPNS